MTYTAPKQVHEHQIAILKKLVVSTGLRFNHMLIEGIDSEHMNYHLQRLMELGFVEKDGTLYRLTNVGKDYTNLLDDNVEKLEKQPKTGVIIRSARFNKEKGMYEDLLMKRLRQPYYGKVGRAGGKVQFGETLEQAARRELKEEMGVESKTMTLEAIYHKVRHDADGICVQDVIFYIFYAEGISGEPMKKTPFQENFWASREEVERNMDPYDDLIYSTSDKPKKLTFEESIGTAQGY